MAVTKISSLLRDDTVDTLIPGLGIEIMLSHQHNQHEHFRKSTSDHSCSVKTAKERIKIKSTLFIIINFENYKNNAQGVLGRAWLVKWTRQNTISVD